jgi:hypothetical protein
MQLRINCLYRTIDVNSPFQPLSVFTLYGAALSYIATRKSVADACHAQTIQVSKTLVSSYIEVGQWR